MVIAEKFTFEYSRVEDRLKMLINYDSATMRRDFFITRAMLFRLIPVIEQIQIKFSAAVAESASSKQHLHVNQHAAPTEIQRQTDRSTLALLKCSETLLLEKVDFTWHHHSKNVTLCFYANGALECKTLLGGERFTAVMQGMIRAVPHTSWGIAPNILEI